MSAKLFADCELCGRRVQIETKRPYKSLTLTPLRGNFTSEFWSSQASLQLNSSDPHVHFACDACMDLWHVNIEKAKQKTIAERSNVDPPSEGGCEHRQLLAKARLRIAALHGALRALYSRASAARLDGAAMKTAYVQIELGESL